MFLHRSSVCRRPCSCPNCSNHRSDCLGNQAVFGFHVSLLLSMLFRIVSSFLKATIRATILVSNPSKKSLIERVKCWVMSRGHKRRHEQSRYQKTPPAASQAFPSICSTISVDRGHANQGRNLTAVRAAEFGQFGHRERGGCFANSGDGFELLQPLLELAPAIDLLSNLLPEPVLADNRSLCRALGQRNTPSRLSVLAILSVSSSGKAS